jgi:thiol-disulfide isomerase/thioredoxin
MRRKWLAALTVTGIVAVSSLVVLLARRVVDLSRAYSELRTRSSLPHAGYVVPTIQVGALNGDSLVVGQLADSGGRQVVFVFTTTCPYCRATLPVWELVFDSVSRGATNGVQVVAMSLDSTTVTSAYAEEHRLHYPIAFFPDWKAVRFFRARVVPQTLVLSHLGEVLYSHVGLLEKGPGLDSLFRSLAAGVQPARPLRGP